MRTFNREPMQAQATMAVGLHAHRVDGRDGDHLGPACYCATHLPEIDRPRERKRAPQQPLYSAVHDR